MSWWSLRSRSLNVGSGRNEVDQDRCHKLDCTPIELVAVKDVRTRNRHLYAVGDEIDRVRPDCLGKHCSAGDCGTFGHHADVDVQKDTGVGNTKVGKSGIRHPTPIAIQDQIYWRCPRELYQQPVEFWHWLGCDTDLCRPDSRR